MNEPIKIKVYDPPLMNRLHGDDRIYLPADTDEDLVYCTHFDNRGWTYVATYHMMTSGDGAETHE